MTRSTTSPKRAGPPSSPASSDAGAGPTAASAPPRYLNELKRCFVAARERVGGEDLLLQIAGRELALRFAGSEIKDALAPAFSHLDQPGPDLEPELTIEIWDAESSGIRPPPIPWHPPDVGALGQVGGFNEGTVRTACDLDYGAITVVDLARGVALFQVPAATRLPWYERAAPLRFALHWLLARSGASLVHAGAVGISGEGVLIAGRGGSGKSTLATAALLHGMEFAGDDYVALTVDGDPVAHSVHATTKLSRESIALLPGLGVKPLAGARAPDEKTAVNLHRLRPGAVCSRLRIRAIVVPRLEPGPGRWKRISGSEGLRALAPSTMFQLPSRDAGNLQAMAELARAVPSYALNARGDPAADAQALEELLRDAT